EERLISQWGVGSTRYRHHNGYSYDNIGQVTNQTESSNRISGDTPTREFYTSTTITYDRAGNRISPQTETRTGNRAAPAASRDYGYDGEGNLIVKTRRLPLHIDQRKQMLRDYRNAVNSYTYDYDHAGRLVRVQGFRWANVDLNRPFAGLAWSRALQVDYRYD